VTRKRIVAGPVPLVEKLKRKIIALGGRVYFAVPPLLYRLRFPRGGRLGPIDHITIATTDLRLAEDFYVGFLGARIVLRVDRAMLLRMGWQAAEIERYHAAHLSLTLGVGPRLDLFEYPPGIPPEPALHPHIALAVAPGKLIAWKRRLTDRGIVVAGPTRAGPPGQASLYFNDPFGNHLELVTIGFVDAELAVGMPDRSRLNYAWRSAGMTSRA
jgi:catechol 2,3-dioxygenase-like lactoylglutathione lyase family enzyme